MFILRLTVKQSSKRRMFACTCSAMTKPAGGVALVDCGRDPLQISPTESTLVLASGARVPPSKPVNCRSSPMVTSLDYKSTSASFPLAGFLSQHRICQLKSLLSFGSSFDPPLSKVLQLDADCIPTVQPLLQKPRYVLLSSEQSLRF